MEKNVLKKHYLVSVSECQSTDPCKHKTLTLCTAAKWKQRPSLAKLRKVIYGNIVFLR